MIYKMTLEIAEYSVTGKLNYGYYRLLTESVISMVKHNILVTLCMVKDNKSYS